jgi:hypothetical protein
MPPAIGDVVAAISQRDGVACWVVSIVGEAAPDATPLTRDIALGRCRELGREQRVRAWIDVEEPSSERTWQLVYDPDGIE